MNNFFNNLGTKTIQLTQQFWQIYIFGQTKIQNFVSFGHFVGTL